MNKSAITISTDYNYIKYLKRALDTLYKHGTIADVYVYAVNFTDDQINELDEYNIKIIRDNNHILSTCKNMVKDMEIEDTEMYHGVLSDVGKHLRSLLYSEQSVYTCHSRFKSINILLDKGYKNILCIDADTLFNKNIDHMFDKTDKDMYVVPEKIKELYIYSGANKSKLPASWKLVDNSVDGSCTERVYLNFFGNEGMLFINNTKNSILFFNDVHNFIFTGNRWRGWDVDGDALESAMSTHALTIGVLDPSYKDSECRDESYIWSGDGMSKYKKTEFIV
jgi:lipopolysaccharide biosynthesis glycosyltransferase